MSEPRFKDTAHCRTGAIGLPPLTSGLHTELQPQALLIFALTKGLPKSLSCVGCAQTCDSLALPSQTERLVNYHVGSATTFEHMRSHKVLSSKRHANGFETSFESFWTKGAQSENILGGKCWINLRFKSPCDPSQENTE